MKGPASADEAPERGADAHALSPVEPERSTGVEAADELATDCHHARQRDQASRRRQQSRVGDDADEEEKQRRRQVPERRDEPLDAFDQSRLLERGPGEKGGDRLARTARQTQPRYQGRDTDRPENEQLSAQPGERPRNGVSAEAIDYDDRTQDGEPSGERLSDHERVRAAQHDRGQHRERRRCDDVLDDDDAEGWRRSRTKRASRGRSATSR